MPGIKDQYSSLILHLVVVPNNRLATTIGHVYLDCVGKHGCTYNPHAWVFHCSSILPVIAITFVMDKGSETRYVYASQTGIRCVVLCSY